MPREYPAFLDEYPPENCVECDVALPGTNQTGFCSKNCEERYCYASEVDTTRLIEELAFEARMAAHFHANKHKYLH
jgi:hypothetical protein